MKAKIFGWRFYLQLPMHPVVSLFRLFSLFSLFRLTTAASGFNLSNVFETCLTSECPGHCQYVGQGGADGGNWVTRRDVERKARGLL